MTGNVRDADRARTNSIPHKGADEVKNVIKAIIECTVISFGVMLILHYRVIANGIVGDEMSESGKCPRKKFRHCK